MNENLRFAKMQELREAIRVLDWQIDAARKTVAGFEAQMREARDLLADLERNALGAGSSAVAEGASQLQIRTRKI
jgi:hypothetical protein